MGPINKEQEPTSKKDQQRKGFPFSTDFRRAEVYRAHIASLCPALEILAARQGANALEQASNPISRCPECKDVRLKP